MSGRSPKRIDFAAYLHSQVVLGDGAMGTALQARGLPVGSCAELWNLKQPETVQVVHEAYLRAGSDLIQTNTFGGNALILARHGLDGKVRELNLAGARVAREVAGDAYVVGSVGPTGQLLEPLGTLSPDEAGKAYGEQVEALAEGGVDALILETFADLGEIRIAIGTAKSTTALPVIATMSFDSGGRTMMGVRPSQAVATLVEAGADAVGANCGLGPDAMMPVVSEMVASRSPVPLVAQPNAGVPRLVEGRTLFDASPDQMAEFARWAVATGAAWVGGCCGSTQAHIACMAAALNRRR